MNKVLLTLALVAGAEVAGALYQQGMLLLGVASPSVSAQSAPADATYLTQTPSGGLSAEQALSGLSDGLLKHASGVVSRAVPGTDYDASAMYRVTANVANSTTTFADVTGLSWSVAASTTYAFSCTGVYTTAVSTTAIQLSLNGPASPTNLRYMVEVSTSATARRQDTQSAYDTAANPGTGHNAGGVAQVWGTLENGSNAGTVAVRVRSEIAASAVTILRGMTCRVTSL